LEHIDWEEWFDAFDSNNLALLYQEKTVRGCVCRECREHQRERMAKNRRTA
jgi:hypothetical protein